MMALAGESLALTASEMIQILEDPIDENIRICDSGSELEGDDDVSDDFQSDNRLISWKKLHHKTKIREFSLRSVKVLRELMILIPDIISLSKCYSSLVSRRLSSNLHICKYFIHYNSAHLESKL
ncbi:hypothetical protein C0J52_27557 [Blattella germanica]|nr:hypothetical protein C0J52_27557 [Blattella germanica]